MMTSISDYLLSAPPSGEDITGDIIPVADVAGRSAALRKEDYYYLRELWSAFSNDGTGLTTQFSSYSFRSLISSTILYYLNQWKSDTQMQSHTHMKAGLSSYSFTGTLQSSPASSPWVQQFFNWMKENNAVVTFDDSPAAPVSYGKIDADVVRYLYKFLTQDMFRQVRDTSLGGTRAFTFTVEPKSIPYTCPKLDSDNNLVSESVEGQLTGSGGTVSANGAGGGLHIGMHSLKKYFLSENKDKYYNSFAFPTSTVTADVTFSAPVVEAYAVITLSLNVDGNVGQGLQLLRPMTGSGVNWSVDLLKRSDYDLVSTNLTVPALDEWVDTRAQVTYFTASIDRVFARFSSPYFALPPEWNW